MSKFTERMASLHITAWNMVVILLWLIWGLFMAGSDALQEAFKAMNNVLIRDWIMSDSPGSGLLKFWFIGLCLLMTVLGVNLIFCSWEKIYKIIRARFNGAKFYMLIVHALFGFVALFHLGGFTLGYERNDITIGNGMTVELDDGYEIKVDSVQFSGDTAILGKSYREITNENFDYKESFVEAELTRHGTQLAKDNISIFRPLRYGDLRITLKSFTPPGDESLENGNSEYSPWIKLTVTRNPVLTVFLFIYPLMIAGILIHLILTWRSPLIDKALQETSN